MKENKKIFHSRYLFYGFLALLLAISTAKFVFAGEVKYIIFDVLLLAIFVVYCIFAKKFKSLVVVLCLFAIGLGWFFVGLSIFSGKDYGTLECEVVGRVSDDISEYGSFERVVLKDVYINGQKESNINLTINSTGAVKAGDMLRFSATVTKVQLFTLGSFNSFYYRDRTPYTCTISSFELTGTGKTTFAEKVRLKVKDLLYSNMGQREGAVAFAVLFGDKSEVDSDIYDAFQSAGVLHLLTVSGLHVSFLIVLLGWVLRKCHVRRLLNFILCGIFLGLYAYFCSFAPSILRAGVMGLVLLATKLCGKQYDGLNSLGLAGIIILCFMPLSALDLGFLMSFFCVLSIYTISPILTKLFKKIFPKTVAESFAISIGVQVGILPFLAMMYSSFNFLTFFVNLIVIPIFSVLFPFLFVCTLLTLMMPFLGFLLKVCGWGLMCIKDIAQFFGLTLLQVSVEPFDIFMVAFAFVGFFLLSNFFMTSKKVKAFAVSGALALCGIFYGLSFVQIPMGTSVSYCYYGSNSLVVLSSSSGQTVAVDLTDVFTKKVLRRLDLKKIDLAFVLQRSSFDYNLSRKLGASVVVRNDNGEGYEEEVLLQKDNWGSFGAFTFRYRYYDDRQLGLEVCFDKIKVFILRDRSASERAINSVASEDFDFVLLGKQDYGGSFNEKVFVMSYNINEFSNSSYAGNGNTICKVKGEKIFRRCLD